MGLWVTVYCFTSLGSRQGESRETDVFFVSGQRCSECCQHKNLCQSRGRVRLPSDQHIKIHTLPWQLSTCITCWALSLKTAWCWNGGKPEAGERVGEVSTNRHYTFCPGHMLSPYIGHYPIRLKHNVHDLISITRFICYLYKVLNSSIWCVSLHVFHQECSEHVNQNAYYMNTHETKQTIHHHTQTSDVHVNETSQIIWLLKHYLK